MTNTLTTVPAESLVDRAVLCRVIAPTTGKGGIFKSATVCAVAVAAARKGARVLVVDVESQGTSSKREFGLLKTEHYDSGQSLADALTATFMGTPTAPKIVEAVRTYPSGGQVDVIVGGPKLDQAIEAITTVHHVQKRPFVHVLAKVLELVAPGYALIGVDNDPKNKALRMMVLTAAACSYAPVDYDIASYEDGLGILRDEIAEAREHNPGHVFLGAVAARMPDPTVRAWRKSGGGKMKEIAAVVEPILASEVFDADRALLPGYPKIFDAMIHDVKGNAADARKAGFTIIDYLSDRSKATTQKELFEEHPVLKDYDDFFVELMTGMLAAQAALAAA